MGVQRWLCPPHPKPPQEGKGVPGGGHQAPFCPPIPFPERPGGKNTPPTPPPPRKSSREIIAKGTRGGGGGSQSQIPGTESNKRCSREQEVTAPGGQQPLLGVLGGTRGARNKERGGAWEASGAGAAGGHAGTGGGVTSAASPGTVTADAKVTGGPGPFRPPRPGPQHLVGTFRGHSVILTGAAGGARSPSPALRWVSPPRDTDVTA